MTVNPRSQSVLYYYSKHARALQRVKTALTRPYPLSMIKDLTLMPIT